MHYLIDLDNTLLDTFFQDKDGKLQFYWTQNFEQNFGQSHEILNKLFTKEFSKQMQTKTDLSPEIEVFLKENNLPLTTDQFLNYWLSRDANIRPDVYDWIKSKKQEGHHMHIASNQPHVRMDYLLERFPDWNKTFEHVFTSARLGVAKPEALFFQKIQKTLKVPFEEICLIDDDPTNIPTVKKLNMPAVLYTDFEDLNTAPTKPKKSFLSKGQNSK